jgi:hypothetical protein
MEKGLVPPIRTLEYGSVQTAKVTKQRIANWLSGVSRYSTQCKGNRSIAFKFASISCGHHSSGVIRKQISQLHSTFGVVCTFLKGEIYYVLQCSDLLSLASDSIEST